MRPGLHHGAGEEARPPGARAFGRQSRPDPGTHLVPRLRQHLHIGLLVLRGIRDSNGEAQRGHSLLPGDPAARHGGGGGLPGRLGKAPGIPQGPGDPATRHQPKAEGGGSRRIRQCPRAVRPTPSAILPPGRRFPHECLAGRDQQRSRLFGPKRPGQKAGLGHGRDVAPQGR